MTIYILSYQHNEHGWIVSYHSSIRDASRTYAKDKRAAKEAGYVASDPMIRDFRVRPTKRAFLEFLNNHTPAHNNG